MNSPSTAATEVDLHRLDRRFESTRIVDPPGIRQLVQSLQAYGQREPVRVVRNADDLVLVDGYRRVQALSQLGRDTALARIEEGSLSAAVLQSIGQHQAHRLQPIEEAWLMAGLVDDGLSQQDIATSLGKDKSWVSRRLALVSALPEVFQEAVRSGELSTWVASRVLLPLARANETDANTLLDALRKEPLSSRALATWFEHYQRANGVQRERMVERPHLFLQALEDDRGRSEDQRLGDGPEGQWLTDVQGLERLLKRLIRTVPKVFDPTQELPRIEVLRTAFSLAAQRFERLRQRLEQYHAIPREEASHPRTASAGHPSTGDQSITARVSQHGPGSIAEKRQGTTRSDPEVAARYLAATRALLEDPGQCGTHPGTAAGRTRNHDSLQHTNSPATQ
jgi:ParB/RepB/Spo0J family partition protein